MKRFFLLLALLPALALCDTLTVDITHPSKMSGVNVPAAGPTSLTSVTVQYGTCRASGAWGTWEGGKTKKLPVAQMTFEDLPNRRTCTRAYWTRKNGVRSAFSQVFIAEATS